MDVDYARSYRELYEHHWWWRAREALLLETLRGLNTTVGAQRILDVGCGSGLFFDRLAEFGEVEGVEPDPMLAAAEPRHRGRIHCGDFLDLLPPHRYDLILMLDVLEHISDAAAAVRHALDLMAPNGRLIVTVPAFPLLWTHHDVVNQHYRRYTRSSLRNVIVNAGGRVEHSRYFFHWTVAAKLAVRMVERLAGPRGPEQLPPPALNRLLYRAARLEQRLIGPLRLPFGTSLLAICSKATADT